MDKFQPYTLDYGTPAEGELLGDPPLDEAEQSKTIKIPTEQVLLFHSEICLLFLLQ